MGSLWVEHRISTFINSLPEAILIRRVEEEKGGTEGSGA